MRQFWTILKFELKNYFTNKIFVGVTLLLVAAISVVLCFPRISEVFDKGEKTEQGSAEGTEDLPVMLLSGEYAPELEAIFVASFPEYEVRVSDQVSDGIKDEILSEKAECAFVIEQPDSYTYYVKNLSMYDSNTAVADELLKTVLSRNLMLGAGMTPDEVQQVMEAGVTHTVTKLGKDQMQNFFYTYIMIMALYMVILLYGQMVATGVATEKSSRAMEVLVTAAKPTSMMFGKITAACLAGLIQLIAVFGSAILFYRVNETYWADNEMIQSIFNMPGDLVAYMLIFFVLGFLIYAFLYGAIGSMANKLEDINTSVMPVMLIFVAAFMIVVMSISNGNVDSTLMKVSSYIPFTSPMAMFARIAMSTVPIYEIILSVVILIVSVVGIGFVSAKIYRFGVLLYGTPPGVGALLKTIRKMVKERGKSHV